MRVLFLLWILNCRCPLLDSWQFWNEGEPFPLWEAAMRGKHKAGSAGRLGDDGQCTEMFTLGAWELGCCSRCAAWPESIFASPGLSSASPLLHVALNTRFFRNSKKKSWLKMSGGHSALACTVSIDPDTSLIILMYNVPLVVTRNEWYACVYQDTWHYKNLNIDIFSSKRLFRKMTSLRCWLPPPTSGLPTPRPPWSSTSSRRRTTVWTSSTSR